MLLLVEKDDTKGTADDRVDNVELDCYRYTTGIRLGYAYYERKYEADRLDYEHEYNECLRVAHILVALEFKGKYYLALLSIGKNELSLDLVLSYDKVPSSKIDTQGKVPEVQAKSICCIQDIPQGFVICSEITLLLVVGS